MFWHQLSGLLLVAYLFFFGHIVTHFVLECVEDFHMVDGLYTLPVALYPAIEAADNLVLITLLLFVPHLCVSGLSFLRLLLLPQ